MVARVSVSKGGRRSLLYGVRRDNRDRVGRSVMPNGTPDVVIFPEAKPGAGVTNRSASPVSSLSSLCVVVVVYPLSQSIQAPPGFGFYVNSFMRRCPANIHHRRNSRVRGVRRNTVTLGRIPLAGAPEIGNRSQHRYNLRSSGAAGTACSPTQP